MSNSSIWHRDRILFGATTSGQSGPGSDGNEEVLWIPQSSSITETSPSDCLMSYLWHSLVGSYHPAEMRSVYSEAAANWALFAWRKADYSHQKQPWQHEGQQNDNN